jgi:hypothetical protein
MEIKEKYLSHNININNKLCVVTFLSSPYKIIVFKEQIFGNHFSKDIFLFFNLLTIQDGTEFFHSSILEAD